MNYRKIDEILEKLEDSVTEDELLHFLMVALGEKPGGLVMDPPRPAVRKLEEALEELGLKYLKAGDEKRSFLNRLLGREDPLSTIGFFFAKDGSRFDILEESEGEFYSFSNDAVGEFLGYPEKSVSFHGSSGKPGRETIKDIKRNHSDLKLKYLALVGYIPAPDREEVKKAVEKGRERAELLEELGKKGLPRGQDLKNELMTESHWN